ncbi:MAG TPA: DUF4332 domain-containing protein [Candidatus Sulfotelmatobacter sp.]|nr:DUF4332 domain-containing protein [Candidatus Sulfotelmatobacter sp.]
MRDEVAGARRLPWYGWLGVATLAAGEAGLALGIYPVQVLFYVIAWWSYILLADAAIWKIRGDSLLRDRPWEFVVLAFWSIPLWNLFEVFNFRLHNWFYVNVPIEPVYALTMSAFAYATVLPGLFETYDLLRAARLAAGAHTRPWPVRSGLRWALVGLGALMLTAPLAWPRVAYPWIWGFAVLLLDPLCHRLGARSLLGQLERGDPRPALRLLAAGLICGGLWEFWNYWSHAKWMYTVPFFEGSKWFEMPPLGFLGFPPFALECYVLVNLLNRVRGGRSWEDAPPRGSGAPRSLAVIGVVAALVWNVAVYAGIDEFTVQSYSPELRWVEGLPPGAVGRLERAGVTRPVEVLRRTATPQALARLAASTGVPEATLRDLRAASRLIDSGGLGAQHYNTLRRLGVTTVEDLARQDPVALHARWAAVAGPGAPTLPQVRVWVRAARARVTSSEAVPTCDPSGDGARNPGPAHAHAARAGVAPTICQRPTR